MGTITLEDGLTYSYKVQCARARCHSSFTPGRIYPKETPRHVHEETCTTVLLGA